MKTLAVMGKALSNSVIMGKGKSLVNLKEILEEISTLQQKKRRLQLEKRTLYENCKNEDISWEMFVESQAKINEEQRKIDIVIDENNKRLENHNIEQELAEESQKDIKLLDILTEHNDETVNQLVEKVIVKQGGHIELIMKNKDIYKHFMRRLKQDLLA